MDLFLNKKGFNTSIFKDHESNKWKFLQDMDGEEMEGVGNLLGSPKPVLLLTVAYILFVKLIGPLIMSRRDAFQLKSSIRFYNLVMVLLAAILLKGLMTSVGSLGAMLDCSKLFNLEDGSASQVYQMSNFILLVRLCEYLDTVFFILRKKQNQVTFLHVFHHAFVPIYAYWILRTAPARYNVFIIIINSFIHVIMYFYYFLATFQQQKGQSKNVIMLIVDKLLLFKRYVTQLQILQFVLLAVYAISVCLRPNWCQVPATYIWSNILLAFTFLSLFLHFYLGAYRIVADNRKKTRGD